MRSLFRVVAIVSLLALMFGSQLCMLVDCAPKAHHATHACCEAAAKKAASSSSRGAAHECGRPCCIAIALPHTPELDRPAAQDAHAALAFLLATSLVLEAPVTLVTHAPPGDDASPPAGPPSGATRLRAPPIA